MQDRHVFEYAVIRLVPRVEREEFLNIGVVLYCANGKFLEMLFLLNEERIRVVAGTTEIDLEEIKTYLQAFESVCKGEKRGGTIALLPVPDRFRWLTATRSTVLQTSKVHVGLCTEPAQTLLHIFNEMVL